METKIPKNDNKMAVSSNITVNEKNLKKRLGMDKSFDVCQRKLSILNKEVHIFFVNGLTDTNFMIEQLKSLMLLDDTTNIAKQEMSVKRLIENHLVHVQVEPNQSLDEIIFFMLSGLMAVFIEGEDEALIVDVRSYPSRGPDEPDTERVVRGARDGYTENIIINTGLTRRRIRDERLRHEIMQVGKRSQTDICVSYIEGIADPDLVDIIKKEIKTIDIDGLTMADKVIEEFIVKQGYNPFPLVRYTERPDVAATHLLEGHIIIFVDASPSVIITPTTLFHHVQHAEEYRQAPAVGTFLRWIRYTGMVLALFLMPFWLLLVMQPSLIPETLAFIGPNDDINIPIFAQMFIAEIGIELLRMAAIHTPSPLATALGLVAALLIGEIAIQVGVFTAEVILYVALGAIGTFATPSYELGVALKIVRLLLLIVVAAFKLPGFVIGTTIFLLLLISIKSLNKPYLWPFLPFDPQGMWNILVRLSIPSVKRRPSITNPGDQIKQGNS
ncbi:spore germination protein [Alkalihalobacillus sp. LMS39]|uniref:spore germination protein n=1 Tax=Alkalihalobacillus sp. LMS39 TaxID=2924032 RepID=UPI0024368D01|nr:spore germination protein [Alkalihalobacillus sp. LMS39]